MNDKKNIIIAVLVVALIALGGWIYYTLTVTVPQQAEAGCKAVIETQVIPQATATAQAECGKVVKQVQETFMQVPACAAAAAAAQQTAPAP
ncbi:MAG: hypothetical protein V1720_12965, partial [bacterium]